jgi:hypothetical protein
VRSVNAASHLGQRKKLSQYNGSGLMLVNGSLALSPSSCLIQFLPFGRKERQQIPEKIKIPARWREMLKAFFDAS